MQPTIIDIPLTKLVLSEANVRKTNSVVGVEELAANIAARGGRLIQSLAVRPVCNEAGQPTGVYRVPAGGRRLAALKLLAKRKVIAKNAPIPCIVCDGDEEEISLSENVMREPLHPADQFDAFKSLHDRGQSADEIGARFGVTAHVVRQRLRLAAVSPVLMAIYREGGLALDQIIAFAITEDHARQEQVHAALSSNLQPYLIRRMLTETQVPARDPRAVFVGAEAYVGAGGTITRDLFTQDGGGWFSDPALLDRLMTERLDAMAAEIKARDGWKWVEASIEYPNAHGMGRLYPVARDLSEEEQGQLDKLAAQYDNLSAENDGLDEIADEVSDELDRLSAEIDSLTARRSAFEPEDIARSGAFVVIGHDGKPRIERGFLRREDERKEEPEKAEPGDGSAGGGVTAADHDGEQEIKPLSDALIRDLTAHRTMALRLTLGEQPEVALLAVIHALALRTFYGSESATCLDLTPKSASLGQYAAGVEDTPSGRSIAERGEAWTRRLPEDPTALWTFVEALEPSERLALLAHCASVTVFAVREPWDRSARNVAASDNLARATSLDMGTHWKPTAATYFGRITKAQIVDAVREAVSDEAARRIEGMAKPAMADAAETSVADRAWLPALLRTPASEEAEPQSA